MIQSFSAITSELILRRLLWLLYIKLSALFVGSGRIGGKEKEEMIKDNLYCD